MNGSPSQDDGQRFTALMTEHGRVVLGYLARRTIPAHDAGDLLSEVFVVAWRRLEIIPADPEQARAWLIAVAAKVLANHRRGVSRRNRLTDRLGDHLKTQVSHHVEAVDTDATDLVRALGQMSGQDRELLTLVAWEELTPAQIAAVLGLSPTVVRKRLERARARLRKAIGTSEREQSELRVPAST